MANGKRNTKMQRRNRKRSNTVGKTKVTKATEMKKENGCNKILRNSKGFPRNIYPQRGTDLMYSTTGSNNEMKVVSLFHKKIIDFFVYFPEVISICQKKIGVYRIVRNLQRFQMKKRDRVN